MVLRRIEAAMARLEAAAVRAGRQASATPETDATARLQADNTRLREAIAASLTQIDSLIAQHDTGQEP